MFSVVKEPQHARAASPRLPPFLLAMALQILQQDFIKTHIHNFLADIVSRESHKIGEGTMVLKAAAVNMLADAEASAHCSREQTTVVSCWLI